MAHVGIHRFAAGHRQKGGAEDRKADVEILMDQKVERIQRTYGSQHGGRANNAVDAEQRDHQRPAKHHRAKKVANVLSPCSESQTAQLR